MRKKRKKKSGDTNQYLNPSSDGQNKFEVCGYLFEWLSGYFFKNYALVCNNPGDSCWLQCQKVLLPLNVKTKWYGSLATDFTVLQGSCVIDNRVANNCEVEGGVYFLVTNKIDLL